MSLCWDISLCLFIVLYMNPCSRLPDDLNKLVKMVILAMWISSVLLLLYPDNSYLCEWLIFYPNPSMLSYFCWTWKAAFFFDGIIQQLTLSPDWIHLFETTCNECQYNISATAWAPGRQLFAAGESFRKKQMLISVPISRVRLSSLSQNVEAL